MWSITWNHLGNMIPMSMVNVLISYTKVSDKLAYAINADPDQTASEGAIWSGPALFTIPLSILWNNWIKKQNLGGKKYGLKHLKL